jgi:O-antigen/teichoic acid export membrane protein
VLEPKRLTQISREVFWVGAGQGLSAIGSLIGIRLLTTALDPGRYGELALGVTVASFAQMSVLQPLYEAGLRYFSVASESGDLPAYLEAVRRFTAFGLRLLLAMSGLLMGAIALFGGYQWLGLAACSVLFCLLSGASVTMSAIQNAARQRAIVAWHEASSQWLRFGLALALVTWIGPRSDIAMVGYCLACFAVFISQYWFLHRNPDIAAARRVAADPVSVAGWDRALRAYAWPVATWGIFVGLYFISGRWALQFERGRVDVGLYAAVNQLGYYPVVMLNMLMMAVAQPILFSRAGAGTDPARTGRGRRLGLALVGATLAATLLATALAGAFHHYIFWAFVAPDYARMSYLLAPMILGSGLFSCGQMVSLVGMINPDTRRLIRPKVGAAVVGTILNFVGAWLYGIDGVVSVTVVYGLLYLAWMAWTVGALRPSEMAVTTPATPPR